jgi:hypothetical protein
MKVLNLTIIRQWFDKLGNGKPEEYRTINPYWCKRLVESHSGWSSRGMLYFPDFKKFDRVLFANGGHFGNVPKKLFEFKGIEIREGNPEWGAEPGKKYFVIKLGERIK